MDPSKNPTDPNRKSSTKDKNKKSAVQLSAAEDADSLLSQIDQNMFSSPDDRSQRFNMASMVHGQAETSDTKNSRYDERDYQSHRRESFPHQYHQPLKPLKSLRRKSSKSAVVDTGEKTEAASITNEKPVTSPLRSNSNPGRLTTMSDTFEVDEEFDPLLVQESSFYPRKTSAERPPPPYSSNLFDDMMENYSKKVQFEVGGLPINGSYTEGNVEKKKHKSHRSKYIEDPSWRLRTGAEKDTDLPLLLQDPDTEIGLPDLDKDDLTSHRFDKGYRRHKIITGVATNGGINIHERKYDHQPHEIFVELDILSGLGEDREWKEAARWIKYEEDVEEDVGRWGKPHVASLSFHSLINLRRLIENGVVLLDLEERDLPGVVYRVVDQMVINELITPENKGFVMRSLLLKHKHVDDSDKNWKFNLRRNTGSLTSLTHNSFDEKNRGKKLDSVVSMEPALLRRNSAGGGGFYDRNTLQELQQQLEHTAIDLSKISISQMSEEDLKWMVNKESILRRIPRGAEASVILVGKDENLDGPALAFVRLAESCLMPHITEVPIPVRFIFILLGPSTDENFDLDYKEIGRSMSTLMSNREFHAIAYKADDRKDLLKGINEYLDESVVLPPGEYEKELFPFDDLRAKNEQLKLRKQRMSISAKGGIGAGGGRDGGDGGDPDSVNLLQAAKATQTTTLKRTRRCFGGLVADIRNRYKYYISDFRDGLSFQCMAAILFIALAQIAGSIAFGGLLSKKTNMKIGISESLLTSGIGGGVFALLSGQPLIIVGVTGPLLLFEESLYTFCEAREIDFLAMRTWIGFWLTVIGLVFVGFEASVLLRFFSRFTQEIFASLICLTFIAESLTNLIKVYEEHPLMGTYGVCKENSSNVHQGEGARPNIALLTTILMFGTFGVAWFFRTVRNSRYLTKCIRTTLGNFAVPIAISCMFLLDFLIKETDTKKLDVGEKFGPTETGRSWFVSPVSENIESWVPAISILPAILIFIVIFMECSIGELLVAKHENRLKKGTGFHLDVLLLCMINTVISFFGLPYVSVALVRAVAHVSACTVWSSNNAPGEKPVIVGVKEQRLTNLVVSILAAASVTMAAVLKYMPLAVLFGVFLFMGISGIYGIQFFERVSLFLKQVENHPQVPFVRRVRTLKMHLFTLIQACWLAILWGIKFTPAALAFPFILALLPPFRYCFLPFIFKPDELSALDSSGDEKKEPIVLVEEPVQTFSPEKSQTQLTSLLNEQAMVDMKSKGDEYNI